MATFAEEDARTEPPEEAPSEQPAVQREGELAPEEPGTSRDESAEPAGEEDPGNEQEMLDATEEAGDGGAGEEGENAGEDDENAGEDDESAGEDGESTGEDDDPAASAERERDEYLALAQRTQAEFENYRKRAAREAAAATQRARSGLVRELLPVLDNLERALASAGDAEQHLAEGVRLVHQELVGVLERNGVEQFDPAGERFDPTFHEALSTREEESTDSGLVLDVVEKGYRADGTVLRPARVVVSG